MKPRIAVSAAVLCVGTALPAAWAADSVQRFAFVVGANSAGSNRPPLKFAVSDAERFARVLADLGGVPAADSVLLKQPTPRALEDGLEALRSRVDAARRAGSGGGARTEVFVYYSGHADETGLLLGSERYAYRALRETMDKIPADVRIAVLDACASGAITRIKGGATRQAFLVDASSSMRGHAFLTSSSADESAQESDHIGASYFTHYLISGLRGAADASGDGTVTLSEAYQFAFRETLGRTTETRGGAQHPSYDISLSGTGEVVMTDLRQTSAGLVLDEEVSGRCYLRHAEQGLVVELQKPKERRVELGVAPGRYEIRCQDEQSAFVAKPILEEDKRLVLSVQDFQPARRDRTLARGSWSVPVGRLHGRHRFELRSGLRDSAPLESPYVAGEPVAAHRDRLGGDSITVGYSRWIRPHLALGIAVSVLKSQRAFTNSESSVVSRDEMVSLLVAVRRDFPVSPRLRPYLTVGGGPFFLYFSEDRAKRNTIDGYPDTYFIYSDPYFSYSDRSDTFGAQVGGGLDLQLGRHLMVGARVSSDFTVNGLYGVLPNYGGLEVGLTVGWLFGKGTPSRASSGKR